MMTTEQLPKGYRRAALGALLLCVGGGGQTREPPLQGTVPNCSLKLGRGEAVEVGVEMKTASGYWFVLAPLDGRWHTVGSAETPGPTAFWTPTDPVKAGVPRKPASNLAYVDATRGRLRASPLGEATRVRVEAKGIKLEDGSRLPYLHFYSLSCAFPAPPM